MNKRQLLLNSIWGGFQWLGLSTSNQCGAWRVGGGWRGWGTAIPVPSLVGELDSQVPQLRPGAAKYINNFFKKIRVFCFAPLSLSLSLNTRRRNTGTRFPHTRLCPGGGESIFRGRQKGRTYQAGNVSLEGSSPVEKEDVGHPRRKVREETAFSSTDLKLPPGLVTGEPRASSQRQRLQQERGRDAGPARLSQPSPTE